jgi:glycosyltransferase involved in cell wall biosynthesis
MATYNGERYLAEQLASIAAQSHAPHELVVCDDRSTDGTVAALERFARGAPFRVHVVRNESRLGYADNFLTAAARCVGELVAFCDQDDRWHERKLEVCATEAARTGAVIVAHTGADADEALRPTGRLLPHAPRRRVVQPERANPWWDWWGFAMVFRRRLLEIADPFRRVESQFLPPGSPLDHDDWISFLGCSLGAIAFVPNRLVLHRRHSATVTTSPSDETRIEVALGRGASWHRAHYGRLARMARERRAFWGELGTSLTDDEQTRARRAAERYGRFALAYDRREGVYAAQPRTHRARRVLSMLGSGAYRARPSGGLGASAFAKDAYFSARGDSTGG